MATDSSKRAQAALLLSTGLSAVRVAEQVSVTPETISRWKMNPDFISLINEYQAERLTVAREQLRSSAIKAVDAITGLIDSSSETIKLKAATNILRLCNIDQPLRLFAGVGPTDPLDVLAELKRQVELESHAFRRQESLQSTR